MVMRPRPMNLVRLLALLGAFAAALCAQTTYVVPAKPGTPEAAQKGTLEVARNGNEVLLSWTLPEGEIRMIEIYRNKTEVATGRERVGTVRTDVHTWHDQVPDHETYWYWLKLTRPNGVIVNLGAVATPKAAVWTP